MEKLTKVINKQNNLWIMHNCNNGYPFQLEEGIFQLLCEDEKFCDRVFILPSCKEDIWESDVLPIWAKADTQNPHATANFLASLYHLSLAEFLLEADELGVGIYLIGPNRFYSIRDYIIKTHEQIKAKL